MREGHYARGMAPLLCQVQQAQGEEGLWRAVPRGFQCSSSPQGLQGQQIILETKVLKSIERLWLVPLVTLQKYQESLLVKCIAYKRLYLKEKHLQTRDHSNRGILWTLKYSSSRRQCLKNGTSKALSNLTRSNDRKQKVKLLGIKPV